jgi:hypothetical protein
MKFSSTSLRSDGPPLAYSVGSPPNCSPADWNVSAEVGQQLFGGKAGRHRYIQTGLAASPSSSWRLTANVRGLQASAPANPATDRGLSVLRVSLWGVVIGVAMMEWRQIVCCAQHVMTRLAACMRVRVDGGRSQSLEAWRRAEDSRRGRGRG